MVMVPIKIMLSSTSQRRKFKSSSNILLYSLRVNSFKEMEWKKKCEEKWVLFHSSFHLLTVHNSTQMRRWNWCIARFLFFPDLIYWSILNEHTFCKSFFLIDMVQFGVNYKILHESTHLQYFQYCGELHPYIVCYTCVVFPCSFWEMRANIRKAGEFCFRLIFFSFGFILQFHIIRRPINSYAHHTDNPHLI